VEPSFTLVGPPVKDTVGATFVTLMLRFFVTWWPFPSSTTTWRLTLGEDGPSSNLRLTLLLLAAPSMCAKLPPEVIDQV
jgi:hypothetical protein